MSGASLHLALRLVDLAPGLPVNTRPLRTLPAFPGAGNCVESRMWEDFDPLDFTEGCHLARTEQSPPH